MFLPLHSRVLLSSPLTFKGSRKHNLKITVKSNSFILQIKNRPRKQKWLAQRPWQYLVQVLVPYFEKLAKYGTGGKYFRLWGHAVSITIAPNKSLEIYKPISINEFQSNTIYKNNDIVYTQIYSRIIHNSQTWMSP